MQPVLQFFHILKEEEKIAWLFMGYTTFNGFVESEMTMPKNGIVAGFVI